MRVDQRNCQFLNFLSNNLKSSLSTSICQLITVKIFRKLRHQFLFDNQRKKIIYSILSKMKKKTQFHVLIKHYFLRKETISQNNYKLNKYSDDSTPSITMVKRWFCNFRCGRSRTSNAEFSACPLKVATFE